ncbi:response regulator [Cohnella faecalis]|uniref:Response regulator n=1 Tax=Cohnella faecalis TaxID=2315694 RepID=A0A398CEQ2_9BACL|nr:response regulator [Cohnella faecalis]RIE00925.1 response regulator [Cohnella faecalis]
MLKMIIVDDEPLIREGLKSMPWERWGCMVAGEAEDGEDGLALVEETRPHFIITDIRMPGMDGLVFSKTVKERYPEVEILMLTGYQDFEYAKTAMHIGIRDLLLKPTKFDELEKAVRKLIVDIRDREMSRREHDRLRDQMRSALPLLKNKLVHDLLHGYLYAPNVIKDRLASFDIQIGRYAVMSIQIDNRQLFETAYSGEDRMLFEYAVMNIAEETAKSIGLQAVTDYDHDLFSIVLSYGPEYSLADCAKASMKTGIDIQSFIRTYLPFTVSIGISEPWEKIEKINQAYLQSIEALNHNFFLGDDALVRFQDIASEKETAYFFEEEDKQGLINGLRAGDIRKVRETVERMKLRIVQSPGVNIPHLKISLMELAFGSVRAIGQFNPGMLERLMQAAMPLSRLESMATVDRLFDECMRMFEDIAGIVDESRQSRFSSTVAEVMKLIQYDYGEDLSLDMLSEQFKLSTAYLSRLIRKETGNTFMANLTEVRLEQAKRLLESGSKKASEIAGLVGYKDFSYFIQVFKKHTGLTPNEYKDQRTGEGGTFL